MNEIHALSGAYAVDALDDIERARFERHLADCSECRAEVAGLREAAAQLSEVAPAPPAAALRDRVLAEIRTVRPLPPLAESPVARVRRWPARLIAAAAVLLVVGLGAVVAQPWQGAPSTADRVLQAGDAVRHQVALRDGGSITVVRSAALGRAVVLTRDLAKPPAGKAYELWLQDARGNMHPAGLITGGGNRTVVMSGDATGAAGAGVTLEPASGSAQPTSAPLALVSFGSV